MSVCLSSLDLNGQIYKMVQINKLRVCSIYKCMDGRTDGRARLSGKKEKGVSSCWHNGGNKIHVNYELRGEKSRTDRSIDCL